MEMMHYSKNPIERIYPYKHQQKPFFKPVGLWVSCETDYENTDWKKWCLMEKFDLEHLTHRYKIEIAQDSNILTLNTPEQLIEFTENYNYSNVINKELIEKLPEPSQKALFTDRTLYMNWEKLVTEYSGIMIYPYIHSMRLDDRTEWYYPWDCSSGCIWDTEIITNITLIEKRKL